MKVEYSRKLSFDTKEITEQEPKFWYKNQTVVIDDRIWEAKILHYYIC